MNSAKEGDGLTIRAMDGEYTICKLLDYSEVWLSGSPASDAEREDGLLFIGATGEENSLVCLSSRVPSNAVARDDGWRAFRIEGMLDFSLTGILSGIAGILAERKIGIFAVSTYNTDYILVKSKDFESALAALAAEGYTVIES